MAETVRILSGEVDLAARIRGPATGSVVVLLHGYPDDSTVWDGVVANLARDFRVVTYDVRGAGASSTPASRRDYRLDQLMGDLAAVLDRLVPGEKVHLVGHDWGSIQGWEALVDLRLKDRILSWTSISGPSLDLAGRWMRDRLKEGAILPVLGQLVRSWYVMLFHLPLLAPLMWRLGLARAWPRLLRRSEGVTVAPRPTQLIDALNGINLYRANFRRHVGRPARLHIATPVQILVARGDRFVSSALYDGLHHHVPDLARHDLAVSHWVPLSRPELIASHVRAMVARIESGQETAAMRRARQRAVADRRRLRFAGQQVLVTGAGGGIGRATALAFAAHGADVIAVDINEAAAEHTAQLARQLGVQANARCIDVTDSAAMEALAAWTDAHCGAVDIVVNNAGIGMAGGFLDTTVGDWQKVLGVNLWGVIHGARLYGQRMARDRRPGHVVNVASAAAFMPSRSFAAYATTKSAVLMMTNCLRAEVAGSGIGVTAVCPGFVETGIAQATVHVGVSGDEQARRRDRAAAMYHRRGFTPEQVAKAIIKAVSRNRAVALVGAEAVIGAALSRLSPGLVRRIARIELAPK